jgi:hypothetical protein
MYSYGIPDFPLQSTAKEYKSYYETYTQYSIKISELIENINKAKAKE